LINAESVDEPWLTIDLDHAKKTPPRKAEPEFIAADTTADLVSVEIDPIPVIALPQMNDSAGSEGPAIPSDIAERLQSSESSDRAAALVDLADAGGDDSFALITKSFDDPSIEVRNAAARALYTLAPDLAASFTRALREASPERRRKIGSAIAGSGLAANAINSLSGEGRDRTYDAFSILFLMAKAGEVQPLTQAIAKHPNTEVRLTAVKLLSLSNQQQVLPNLRSLASRDILPEEVHAAVMEAIYTLSNQTREVA
jgi:HEAT repeat protein